MTTAAETKFFLKKPAINGWSLFWLIAIPICVLMVVALLQADISSAQGVIEMIAFSVRVAVPFIFLVVATSALQKLFPGPITAWLLRNRRYIGFCFAVAMLWQALFIAIMSTTFRDHYFDEVYFFRDELEGSTGYVFLSAMVLTSFRFGRKRFSQQQWRLLHLSALYFLWAYPFSVYWWNVSYYARPGPVDYVFYAAGFSAFALRIAAWGKQRLVTARIIAPESRFSGSESMIRVAGAAIIVAGLLVSVTGCYWQSPVSSWLTTLGWSANLELWLPYWPFEPFLSLCIIGFGTLLATSVKKA